MQVTQSKGYNFQVFNYSPIISCCMVSPPVCIHAWKLCCGLQYTTNNTSIRNESFFFLAIFVASINAHLCSCSCLLTFTQTHSACRRQHWREHLQTLLIMPSVIFHFKCGVENIWKYNLNIWSVMTVWSQNWCVSATGRAWIFSRGGAFLKCTVRLASCMACKLD